MSLFIDGHFNLNSKTSLHWFLKKEGIVSMCLNVCSYYHLKGIVTYAQNVVVSKKIHKSTFVVNAMN